MSIRNIAWGFASAVDSVASAIRAQFCKPDHPAKVWEELDQIVKAKFNHSPFPCDFHNYEIKNPWNKPVLDSMKFVMREWDCDGCMTLDFFWWEEIGMISGAIKTPDNKKARIDDLVDYFPASEIANISA